MAEVGQIVVFVMVFVSCNALLDLSGVHQVEGTWMGSTTLPCTYVPSEGFTEQVLSWSVERDSSTSTVFRRDDSGDHTFLSNFRGRVSVPKHSPGNASLVIEKLEMPDSGHYTCQVTWRSTNNSLVTREVTTIVKIVKVAATKPIIRPGELGLRVPAGASTSLTCQASRSPPISYRWFRSSPGGTVPLQSSGAQLVWASLRPSDSGTYFCEAANRAGAGVAQQSDAVELTVTDLPTTTAALWRDVGTPGRHHLTTGKTQTELVFRGTSGISWTPWDSTSTADLPTTVTAVTSESGVGYPEKNYTTQDLQRTGLSLPLVVLIAVVCAAVVFLGIFLIVCIRRPKDAQAYDVKFHSSRAAASSRHESTGHYEEPISFTENNYVMEPRENKSTEVNKNVSDCVGNPQEHEYEVGDTS